MAIFQGIRFPFHLKGKQPDYCGGYHPSFDLSCTPHSIYPTLQLPNFVNVCVKKINYKSQTIHISDADGCFPRQLKNLHLSASPFQFLSNYDYCRNLSFINCSQTLDQFWMNGYQIACLSDQSHQVYATDSVSFPDLFCTKMYSMTPPYEFFGYASITFDDLHLTWSKPECGNCEAQGKYCRFKNNNSSGSNSKLLLNGTTECLDKPKQPSMDISLYPSPSLTDFSHSLRSTTTAEPCTTTADHRRASHHHIATLIHSLSLDEP